MSKNSVKNLTLTSYDDIFQTDDSRADAKREKVIEVPLSELHPFKYHPFKVADDEAMMEMVESVAQYGVLVPGVVRPRDGGGYELIAGHRRRRASELAKKETMPVLVRNLTDDEAIVAMVDSNLQRESLLFSERAFAYKMKMEAVKRQAGRPAKDNSQGRDGLTGKTSCSIVSEQSGESKNQIYRYIRLTELVTELLDMVDAKRIGFNPAVELSYLRKEEQALLLDVMGQEEATPSLSQAQRLKKHSQDGTLTVDIMNVILSEEKKATDKITFTGKSLAAYFPDCTPKQVTEEIFKILESWFAKRPAK